MVISTFKKQKSNLFKFLDFKRSLIITHLNIFELLSFKNKLYFACLRVKDISWPYKKIFKKNNSILIK